ncbi:MAG: hypothetical protein IPK39_16910 [Sulfuritalea sp.]|nr:hypothetical protein [Sulfuritalea sp.]
MTLRLPEVGFHDRHGQWQFPGLRGEEPGRLPDAVAAQRKNAGHVRQG